VPAATPETIPVDGTTVAIVVLPLLHVPAPLEDNAVAEPAHTLKVPVIAAGIGFTVTTTEAKQLPAIA
jgi:hypothetical protein